MTDSARAPERDFFISYTGSDRPWAEWIGWILEESGYTVFIDIWDFRAGKNFALEMQKGTQCKKTIAVLSQQYLEADYTNPEWAAAFAADPQGDDCKLIPVRIEEFDPKGFLQTIVYVDFVGIDETKAQERLINALKPRGKPEIRPRFPGSKAAEMGIFRSVMQKVGFPGYRNRPPKEVPSPEPQLNDEPPSSSDAENGDRNPFWPRKGVIEDPAQFFNCEGTLNRIFESLNSGSSVAIIGDNNTGKSSLLWAIARMADEYLESPRQPVLLNLAKVFSEQDFYEDLCEALEMESVSGQEFVREMYRQKKRVLLLLDEVERISQKDFTHNLRQELRGLAEGGDAPLRIVITARTSLDQLFSESYVDGQTSPLEGITVEEHIPTWSDDICRNFIATRLANSSIQFTAPEITQLIKDCNGNPQQLTQACHTLFNQYRENSSQP